jgi:hypothetical protein
MGNWQWATGNGQWMIIKHLKLLIQRIRNMQSDFKFFGLLIIFWSSLAYCILPIVYSSIAYSSIAYSSSFCLLPILPPCLLPIAYCQFIFPYLLPIAS